MLKDAKQGLGTALKKIFKILGWLIPVGGLLLAVIYLARGNPNPTGPSGDPKLLLPKYVETVLPYAPPATQLPVQTDYETLLAFFSDKDRTWVKENFNGLAWLGFSQDDRQYRPADEQKKMQAVYRLIVSRGPTQALTVLSAKPQDDKNKDRILIRSSTLARKYDVEAVLEGGRWRIVGLWGIPSDYATQLSRFQASYGTK